MKSENEYYYEEVSNFEIIDCGTKENWVYDIEIENNHNFFGNDILLHNSVYVQSKNTTIFSLLKEGRTLIKQINESYIEFASNYGSDDCSLEMEFEKIFKVILFVEKKGGAEEGAKKTYAYLPLWIDGKKVTDKIEYIGFAAVRSDTPRVARKIQKTVLKMVLRDKTKEEVMAYLKNIEKGIRNKTIPDEEIGFPKGISEELHKYGLIKERDDGTKYKSGTPPVVKGAKYSNKYLGTQFGKGSKPKWIYIKSVPHGYPDTNVVAYDEFIPEGFIPDYDLLYERIFKMKLNQIFKAAGFGELPDMDGANKTLDIWVKQ